MSESKVSYVGSKFEFNKPIFDIVIGDNETVNGVVSGVGKDEITMKFGEVLLTAKITEPLKGLKVNDNFVINRDMGVADETLVKRIETTGSKGSGCKYGSSFTF